MEEWKPGAKDPLITAGRLGPIMPPEAPYDPDPPAEEGEEGTEEENGNNNSQSNQEKTDLQKKILFVLALLSFVYLITK